MKPATILIVEDEQIVALDLQHMLSGLGYNVLGIAVDEIDVRQLVSTLMPDLVLMDINLQGNLDGIELAQKLRTEHDLPIIYLTAYSDADTLRRATVTGPFGYVIKPFSEREIYATVEMALYKHQAERELKESQEWLATTLRSIGDAVIATDQTGRIKFLNTIAETLTGWKEADAIGKPLMEVFQIINEETGERPEDPVARVLREGKAVGLANHTILISLDGQQRFIDDSAAPILSPRGTITGVVLTFRDVTERRTAEAALQASETQLRLAFEQIPAIFWTTDRELRYTSSTGKGLQALNSAPGRIVGVSLYDYLHTTDPTSPVIAAHLSALQGKPATYDITWQNFAFQGYVEPLHNSENHIIGCIGVALDISERKQAEAVLHQHNQYLAALHDITLGLLQNLDLHNLLRAIVQRAMELVKTQNGFLEIFDTKQEVTRLEIALGHFEHHAATWKPSPLGRHSGVTQQAFATGRTVVVDDYSIYAHRQPNYDWLRTSISLPLHLGNDVLGVIGLGFETVTPIQPIDIDHLEQFAGFASLAMRNAQLYAAAQQEIEERTRVEGRLFQQNDYLQALHEITIGLLQNLDLHSLLEAVMTRASDLVNAPHGFLEILDESRQRLLLEVVTGYYKTIAAPSFPVVTTGAVGRALSTGQTIVVEDYASFEERTVESGSMRSVICVPLLVGNNVLGVIGLSFEQAMVFQAEDIQQLEQFARFASLAVYNAQLYAAAQQEIEERTRAEGSLHRQNEYLRVLHETTLGLIQNLDLHTLLETIIERVADLLRTPHIFLNIFDRTKLQTRLVIAQGRFEQYFSTWNPVENRGASQQAFVTRQTVIIEDYRMFEDRLPDRDWLRTVVNVPLRLGKEVLGVIGLGFEQVVPIQPQDIQRLELFAQFASLAVNNAQLYAAAQKEIDERKRAEEALRQSETSERDQRILAEALKDTAAALTSTLDLETVLARLLDNVGHVVPHDSANIMLRDGDMFRVAYFRNVDPDVQAYYRSFRYPVQELWVYRTMEERNKPTLVSDTKNAPDWVSFEPTSWIRSYIGFPIFAHGELIGMLNIDSATPNFFTEAHAQRLEAFANQVAIAVANAQMYDQVQRHAAELEQRVLARTAEVMEKQAQLEAILEAMNEGVAYIDFVNGEVHYLNPAFTGLTGLLPEAVIGQPLQAWGDIFESPKQTQTLIAEASDALIHGKVWRTEVTIQRRDGGHLLAELTGLGISGSEGRVVGAVLLIRDIRQEKALQAQKDQFIANAAHELRTPITNLYMRLYLARKQPEKVQEHLVVLETTAQRLKGLVENLLDISRFEHGIITLKRRFVILQDLVEQVVEEQRLYSDQKALGLEVRVPALPLYGEIDPDRIEQVITNLLMNAINYTPGGGMVQVQLFIRTANQTRYAVIEIQDTGIGIPTEALPHLFEPFYRAAPEMTKGTGLGLTLCKDIIDLHGGHIDVESQLGAGSTFRVWLPLQDAQIDSKVG